MVELRTIYFWAAADGVCYMLYLYAKNEQGDLTATQPRTLARVVREEFMGVGTLRNWGQGWRMPDGSALALLRVATHDPAAVVEALHRSRRRGAA